MERILYFFLVKVYEKCYLGDFIDVIGLYLYILYKKGMVDLVMRFFFGVWGCVFKVYLLKIVLKENRFFEDSRLWVFTSFSDLIWFLGWWFYVLFW